MFYQMSYPDYNPLSPRKVKNADPDAHAHSPRRGALAGTSNAIATRDSSIAPHSLLDGKIHPGMGMLPPPFKAHRHLAGDPFLSQYHYHDSFNGIAEPPFRRNLFQGDGRHTSSSGDISMHDAPARSATSDEVMVDYIRPFSPTSRLNNYALGQSSRPFSPEGYRTLSLLEPSSIRSRSPPHDRHVSAESLRGPRMQRFFDEFDLQSDREAQLSEQSQFAETIDAMSPRKVPISTQSASKNTRVSSAANLPTPSTKPSAAAEARASSYSGKNRSTSQASFNLPQVNHAQLPFQIASKSRSGSHKHEPLQPSIANKEIHDKNIRDPHKVVRLSPSAIIKSRKENKPNEMDQEGAKLSQAIVSAGAKLDRDEEVADENRPPDTHKKRRRATSNSSSAAMPVLQETGSRFIPEGSPSAKLQTDLPEKMNDVDDLTPEGVFSRGSPPLGSINNRADSKQGF